MTRNQKLEDRRKFPRYQPDQKNTPAVKFIFSGSSKVSINTINISKGGLMGYTSSIEHFLGIQDQFIDVIEIIFPNKEPFRCSGRILRLQPSINENKCYCAVEFGKTVSGEIESFGSTHTSEALNSDHNSNNNNGRTKFSDSSIYNEPLETNDGDLFFDLQPAAKNSNSQIFDSPPETDSQKENNPPQIPDWKIVKRIRNIENYANIDDVEKEVEIRRQAYNSFDDITDHLTIEEKWWFFEMLDEMKRHEPNYPENLKQAFFQLYRTGMEQAQGTQFKKDNRFLRQG